MVEQTLIDAVEENLRTQGYIPRRAELVAIAGALASPPDSGAPAILLQGPPGCGKTAVGEALAKSFGSHLVYALLHAWTDSDELFMGVDVAEAVAGNAQGVRLDGVLARAARLSDEANRDRPVVVLLDEVDKIPDRTEMLLLDWLQSGRVPIKPGHHIQTKLGNVIVFLTSNGLRPMSDPLLRRVRRVVMSPLDVKVADKLVAEVTGVPMGVVTCVNKAAREVAVADGNHHLSLQELIKLNVEIMSVATDLTDIRYSLAGWAARTEKGAEKALQTGHPAAIWGEVTRARRGEQEIKTETLGKFKPIQVKS